MDKKTGIRWITIFITSFTVFICSYILAGSLNLDFDSLKSYANYIYGIVFLIVFVINFAIILFGGTLMSIRSVKDCYKIVNSKEGHKWYVYANHFALCLFSLSIVSLGIVWTIMVIGEGILGKIRSFDEWCISVYTHAKVWFIEDNSYKAGFDILGKTTAPFGIYITIILSYFIWYCLFWSVPVLKNYKRQVEYR